MTGVRRGVIGSATVSLAIEMVAAAGEMVFTPPQAVLSVEGDTTKKVA